MGGCQSDSELCSVQFSLSMAREKTDAWLTEAARLSTTLGLHSPVLQRCMRMLEDFRNYLPLLTKLGSLQLQNFHCQSLLRGVFGRWMGNIQCLEQLFPTYAKLISPGGTHSCAPSLQHRVLSTDGIGCRLGSEIWGLSCAWTLGSEFLALCCTPDIALQSKLVWARGRNEH